MISIHDYVDWHSIKGWESAQRGELIPGDEAFERIGSKVKELKHK